MNMERYRNFEFSIFLTVGCINGMFGEGCDPDEQFAYFSKHIKFSKVYLEAFRGQATPLDRLLKAKKYFEDRGIRTATAIMPSSSPLYPASARMLCYTSDGVKKLFSEYIASMADYFDEIMIDDSLATDCTCERCRAAKGDRSWTEFRLQLMTDFCRDYIVAPAKRVNPNVTMTIKYPTWHDSYQTLGYNTETQPPMFDATYSGTETRHTTYALFRNPRYTSYSLIRYLQSCPPHNNRGGWFDDLMCANDMNVFTQQAELTLLSAPKEVTLFCWSCNRNTMFPPAMSYFLDRTDRILDTLGEPAGLPVYLPHHSRGEDYVADYLGMCGVPTDPAVEFPAETVPVLLTGASCCDSGLIGKIRRHLLAGGDVILTSGCFAKLQEDPAFEFSAMRVTGRSVAAAEFGGFDNGWSDNVAYESAAHPVSLPVIEWQTNENEFFAVQAPEMFPNILLARSWFGPGKLWLLNIPDNYADLMAIPGSVMSYVRKYLSKTLNVWLEGQNRVAVFPRRNNTFALYNFMDHGAPVLVHVQGRSEQLTDLVSGRTYAPYRVTDGETVYRLSPEPNTLAAFRYE